MNRLARSLALLATLLLPAGLSVSKTLASEATPSLGLGIPESCLGYLHVAGEGSWGRLGSGLDSVGEKLAGGSLPGLLLESILSTRFPAEEEDVLREEAENFEELLEAFPWGRLLGSEVALGLRFEYPRFDLLGLFRMAPADRARAAELLQEILESLAALDRDYQIEERSADGRLSLVIRSRAQPQVELCVGARGDVLLVSTSGGLLRHSLQLLEGSSRGRSFPLSEASARLPAVPSGRRIQYYLEPTRYFEELRRVVEVLEGENPDGPTAISAARLRHQLLHVIRTLDLVDWLGGSIQVNEKNLRGDLRIRGTARADASSLIGAFSRGKPAAGLLPPETKSFGRIGGIRFRTLIRELLEIASGDESEYRQVAEAFEATRKDRPDLGQALGLLETLEGPWIFHPRAGGSVLRTRLTDREATAKSLESLAEALKPLPLYGWRKKEVEGVEVHTVNCPLVSGGTLHLALREDELLVFSGESDPLPAPIPAEGVRPSELLKAMGLEGDGPATVLELAPWRERIARTLSQAAFLGAWLGSEESGEARDSARILAGVGQLVRELEFLDRLGLVLRPADGGLEGSWILELGSTDTPARKQDF